MRIFFSLIVILLGANLAIELMNSSMMDVIKERGDQIERAWEM